MPSVLAVNNYPTGERFDRLKTCLLEAGADVHVSGARECSSARFGDFDGVVLSGSPDMLSSPRAQSKYKSEADAVREASSPVLGVCFGHQLMALSFGSRVVEDVRPVLGFVRTEVIADDRIFAGLPKANMLLESRHEVVASLPRGFRALARSETSKIAAMKHCVRPLYGVQFHPERYTSENPAGRKVIENFVGLLA